ncbi:flavodoxin family protein [Nesterenkonia haasae]|uniref:flavodoxin family protein n=1 Tax=Nesterenkonia haasae TaxID=2587813 RepID=UPI001390F90E|nr:flavodoxin family protein [Nesterenkonia haasae]NDK33106.1 flavodoxin family protein [Nesterenkonia haasae]
MTSAQFSGLKAMIFNGTLTRAPGLSHTDGLISAAAGLMERNGVEVEVIRTIDCDVATGVYPDMRDHGWDTDEWPEIFDRVRAANILILAGPIWLGDNSSETKKIVERLYSNSGDVNDAGQYVYYGKVGGALITGNEDGIKHCTMNLLYSLQHIGCVIPPQADAGWIGEVGPGPSYLDPNSGGPENDFTNRNLTFMTYNLMHMAALLRDRGGIPAYGNVPEQWQKGERFGFVPPTAQA